MTHNVYKSFAELAEEQVENRDFRRVSKSVVGSRVAIVAPHGGRIEPGTSQIARLIARNAHSLYLFEGLKAPGENKQLHITSHLFDEPRCVQLVRNSLIVVTIHGCLRPDAICLGGRDTELKEILDSKLRKANLPALLNDHPWDGLLAGNICNLGERACGVQLEISRTWRAEKYRLPIANAVRESIVQLSATLQHRGEWKPGH